MRVMYVFIKGYIIGISIAAPVGPIGLLCIQRTLVYGRRAGAVSGLGAACADSTYAAIAGFGLSAVAFLLLQARIWIALIGGVALLYLGARSLFAKTGYTAAQTIEPNNLFWMFGSTYLLTMSNPTTILSFLAVFAAIGAIGAGSVFLSAALTVAGVFLGSASWWLILSALIHWLKKGISPQVMNWVNRASALVIIGFGVYGVLLFLISVGII